MMHGVSNHRGKRDAAARLHGSKDVMAQKNRSSAETK
jgi:hypothetical protein